jgi:hypothetical protein
MSNTVEFKYDDLSYEIQLDAIPPRGTVVDGLPFPQGRPGVVLSISLYINDVDQARWIIWLV